MASLTESGQDTRGRDLVMVRASVLWRQLCVVQVITTSYSDSSFQYPVCKASWFLALESISPTKWRWAEDLSPECWRECLLAFHICLSILQLAFTPLQERPVGLLKLSAFLHRRPPVTPVEVSSCKKAANPSHPCCFHPSCTYFLFVPYACVWLHLIRLLPYATVWNEVHFQIQSQTKQKGRKSWKRKLVTAISMDLIAGSFALSIKYEWASVCGYCDSGSGHRTLSEEWLLLQPGAGWLAAGDLHITEHNCEWPWIIFSPT